MTKYFIGALVALWFACHALAQPVDAAWRALASGRYDPGALGALRAAGYTLHRGKVVWYGAGQTPPPARGPEPATFYVNNPITVYGGVRIPVDGGTDMSDIFELDGDAAIAIFGVTPPPITYFSFTMNEYGEYPPGGDQRTLTNSSVALSVNNENIATVEGRPFDAHFVLVIAAQHAAAQRARDFFVRLGIPAASINTILFPHRFTRQSNSAPPSLNVMNRLTYRTAAEHEATLAFIQRPVPAMNALYFKGPGAPGDVLDAELPRWESLLRDDRSEFAAEPVEGLNLLAARVQQHYADLGYEVLDQAVEILHHIDPQRDCRDLLKTCNYDAPDALYGRFYCQRGDGAEPQLCTGILPDSNRRAVIVGLNHHRFGQDELATYFSYAVTRLTDLQGIATLTDVVTEGSAAAFMADQPNPDNYYVITIARDCGAEPFCMQVPFDDEPGMPGLPRFGRVEIATRVYLDKIMGTAPNPANFLGGRLFWIRR